MKAAGLPRLEAIAAMLPWIAALFAPAYEIADGTRDTRVEGWSLAAFGWLGPLAGCFAWYANILLFVAVGRLLRGRPLGRRLALWSGGLALTVVLPAFVFDPEVDGRFHRTVLRGPAVWLWLTAFLPIAVASFGGRREPAPFRS